MSKLGQKQGSAGDRRTALEIGATEFIWDVLAKSYFCSVLLPLHIYFAFTMVSIYFLMAVAKTKQDSMAAKPKATIEAALLAWAALKTRALR